MTLAQNRLPLLNGNKIVVFLLILIGMTSCAAAAKKISSSPPAKAEVVSIKTTIIEKNKKNEDSILRKPEIFDLINNVNNSNTIIYENIQPIENSSKKIINIAVILPFLLDQIPLGQYADDTTKQLNPISKFAMDFYLGCQMAKEKYTNPNLTANVYFLDDMNDNTTTTNILQQKPFPNVDYIIGPLNEQNLTIVSDYARTAQIPMIFPLANTSNISNNPNYFNSVPSVTSQYNFITEQIKNNFLQQKIEILYDDKDSTEESIETLKPIIDKYFNINSIKYYPLQSWSDAAKNLYTADTISNRTILIYSSKGSYIKSIIAKLKPIKNHLNIFTSMAAKGVNALSDNKNPHTIYVANYFDTNNPNYTIFAQKFEEKYRKETTETVNQAYDLMMYLFNTIENKQPLQSNTYNFSNNLDNTHTKFIYKPVFDKHGSIDYFDNAYLKMYKYTNGKFVAIAP